jgi:hypothetical protein
VRQEGVELVERVEAAALEGVVLDVPAASLLLAVREGSRLQRMRVKRDRASA